jgi:16S rRNA (guanine527-N7)-methyltransferase
VFAELLRCEFELPGDQVAKLEAHYNLLCKWNRVLNLTTMYKVEEAVERHYWESLFLARHLPPGSLRLVDIGSGAGFPGLPVAVARPDCEVTLVESRQRKAVFLREASRELPNVRVIAGRAETIAMEFDRATSRAVSYEDLTDALKSLAPAVDLLTGAEDPPQDLGFSWEPPIRLPWGKQRFLRCGSRT